MKRRYLSQVMFYHLRGEKLSQWMADVNSAGERENKLFDEITDFLKSTGVNQLASQVRNERAYDRVDEGGQRLTTGSVFSVYSPKAN